MPYWISVILFVPVDKAHMLRSAKAFVIASVNLFVLIDEVRILFYAFIQILFCFAKNLFLPASIHIFMRLAVPQAG